MTALAFRKGVTDALLAHGFQPHGKSLRRDQSGVSVLVSFEKGFGSQWFIVVGFWLHSLGEIMTDRVEGTHLYFRLERLLPGLREAILKAGALGDAAQHGAYETLLTLLRGEINDFLRTVGTDEGLRNAIQANELADGLIRKEAREYLQS